MKSKPHSTTIARWEWFAIGAILFAGALARVTYWRQIQSEPALHAPVIDSAFHDYWARAIVTGDWSVPEGISDPLIQHHPYGKPPGYPYFLAMIYFVAGPNYKAAIVVQMAMGLLNALLTWAIARWLLGRVAGLVAAAILATYWLLIYFESELQDPVLTITMSLIVAITLMHWLRRPRWSVALFAGVAFGALAIVRSNMLPMLPLTLLMFAIAGRRRIALGRIAAHALLFAAGTAAMIAPVTIRNWQRGGEFVLISANAGLNLYVGNNPQVNLDYSIIPGMQEMIHTVGWSHFEDLAMVRAVEAKVGRRLGYNGVSNYFADRAWAFIRENPKKALSLTMRRAARMLSPNEYTNNMICLEREASPVLCWMPGNFSAIVALALAGLMQWGFSRRKIAPNKLLVAAWMFAYVFILFAGYVICFIESRYRTPMIPFIVIPAALCVTNLVRFAARRDYMPIIGSAAMCVGIYAALWWPTSDYAPDRAYWHYLRATQYATTEDVPHFAAECEEAYRLQPNNAMFALKLGRARMYQNRCEDAIPLLKRSIELKPDYGEAWESLGDAFLQLRQYEPAQAALMNAMRLDPENKTTADSLARTLQLRGLTPEQIQAFWDELDRVKKRGTTAP